MPEFRLYRYCSANRVQIESEREKVQGHHQGNQVYYNPDLQGLVTKEVFLPTGEVIARTLPIKEERRNQGFFLL